MLAFFPFNLKKKTNTQNWEYWIISATLRIWARRCNRDYVSLNKLLHPTVSHFIHLPSPSLSTCIVFGSSSSGRLCFIRGFFVFFFFYKWGLILQRTSRYFCDTNCNTPEGLQKRGKVCLNDGMPATKPTIAFWRRKKTGWALACPESAVEFEYHFETEHLRLWIKEELRICTENVE